MSFRINTNITSMNALRNMSQTSDMYSKSVNKLSTGLRINSAADDPAGLIFSENFRAQIGGITQAVLNNQDAINYSKTAEGALDELSKLLQDGRTLAVSSANTAVLSSDQLQANQTQWNQIVDSINRIASQTSFGTKKLLDGSSGATASILDPAHISSISFSGTFSGSSVTTDGNMAVNVTTAATKATTSSTVTVAATTTAAFRAASPATTGTFYLNGTPITVNAGDTWGDVIDRINVASKQTGITAEATSDGTNGFLKLTSTTYGTKGNFTLTDPGILLSAAGTASATGVNAVADVTVGGQTVTFQGGRSGYDGLTLSDTDGNVIKLDPSATVSNYGNVGYINVGTAQFQTGPNANNRTSLNIGSFTASALGVSALDMTSAATSTAAIDKIDEAISLLNTRRGSLGSFMKNVLESNVRSLGVQKENLSASESAVRDVDVAEEMTNYTKLQILSQSGIAVLAQANQMPQQVLSLLRG